VRKKSRVLIRGAQPLNDEDWHILLTENRDRIPRKIRLTLIHIKELNGEKFSLGDIPSMRGMYLGIFNKTLHDLGLPYSIRGVGVHLYDGINLFRVRWNT
jgi:hypothetical protein